MHSHRDAHWTARVPRSQREGTAHVCCRTQLSSLSLLAPFSLTTLSLGALSSLARTLYSRCFVCSITSILLVCLFPRCNKKYSPAHFTLLSSKIFHSLLFVLFSSLHSLTPLTLFSHSLHSLHSLSSLTLFTSRCHRYQMQVLGVPPSDLLRRGKRTDTFFDADDMPKHLVDRKGRTRPPGSRSVHSLLFPRQFLELVFLLRVM
jgi:hypothetical protein